jgi:superfamily I DNA/RNA helicase
LPQSYRVPQSVQKIANQILDRIPDLKRVRKQWKARDEKGNVEYITDIDGLPLHQGQWLILARYNDRLTKLMPDLKDRGVYFQYKNRKSYKVSLFRTILNYIRWQKGELLSLSEVKDVLECANSNLKPTEEKMYDLAELTFSKDIEWFDEFNVDYEECLYIREMLRMGEKLSKDARVKLSTMHAAKGGEADNVLLILDNTKTIRESAEKNEDKADEENRVWYVGVTRTKQNLYIMSARKEDRGYDIESLG